jgi:hypothetical protein
MNKKNQFSFNFLQNQKKFLALDKNLDSSLVGVKISDCLNFNPNCDKGCTLNEFTIPDIGKLVYENFCGYLKNMPDFKFENTKMYIYTLVKVDVLDILFVYKIHTKKIRMKRKTWMKPYIRFQKFAEDEFRFCCIKKFIPPDQQNIKFDEKSLQERNKKLDYLCCFPRTFIDPQIASYAYLLNLADPKVDECFSETQLIFHVDPFEHVTTQHRELLLTINSYSPPDFPPCTELYTDLNIDNLSSFIKDCLITCYRSEDAYIRTHSPFKHEDCLHEVLFLTVE